MLRVGSNLPASLSRTCIHPLLSSRTSAGLSKMTTSATPPPKRGALVVVEGIDRAGKTIQCTTIQQLLEQRGHMAKYVRFPGMLAVNTRRPFRLLLC